MFQAHQANSSFFDKLITIQSMTDTNTNDVQSTFTQCLELWKAGCEVIRISVPGKKEVKAFQEITSQLREIGCDADLVADIHFNPQLAIEVAPYADKVRINPGNFLSESELSRSHTDQLILIHERLKPLVQVCKHYHTRIRIGLNGGSIYKGDDRTLTQHELIVQLIDYIQIFRHLNFHDLVLSIKFSDAKACIEVNQELKEKIDQLKWKYPIHIGVTESGNGIEGRVKSFLGIGQLVSEGIGETIRFSLAENPVNEVTAAKAMLNVLKDVSEKTKDFDDVSAELKSVPFKNVALDQAILVDDDQLDQIPAHLQYVRCELRGLKDELHRQTNHGRLPILLQLTQSDQSDEWMASNSLIIGQLLKKEIIHGIDISTASQDDRMFLKEFASNVIQVSTGRLMNSSITACPGCSRNQLNLERIVNELKFKYSDRRDLQFSVMGCSVNGYGEMLHSNVGIVGKMNGKMDIYIDQVMCKKNVKEEDLMMILDEILETKSMEV